MSLYYLKKHDLKEKTTEIEGIYITPEQAEEEAKRLCDKVDKAGIPVTFVYTVEDSRENLKTYKEIFEEVMAQSMKMFFMQKLENLMKERKRKDPTNPENICLN